MLNILRIKLAFVALTISLLANASEQPSVEAIKRLAEQGDAIAQAKYGAIFFLGDTYTPKPSARYKTKQKYESIAYLLEGVKKDEAMATQWMLKAVSQGYVDAEVFMAAMYDRGMGVPQNPSEATKLYKKAKEHGNETAGAILGRYANTRMTASKDIPVQYALKILTTN